jgi:RNA polymerase-binding transcription factor DksA
MPSNEITRYTDEELKEFEAIIDAKLAKARHELDFYTKQLQNRAENADSKLKGLDDGISTAELERVTTLASRQRKHIQHLENAKLRIKNKVYGICRASGKLISKERLRAVPHATLSIAAKQSRIKRRR